MKPVSAPAALKRIPLRREAEDDWRTRSARLYTEFERQARQMVRRAFRGAFGEDELDDIYSNAWLGTLRALESRHLELSDEQIRSYVLTAVANQASREIRRRKRKPTAPLELAASAPDEGSPPEELAANAERARITRDLLVSLPPRRRAVMLLRYGWGLEPEQVCRLVAGLSPRAYRKEVTRGVDELTEKMRIFERGEWCSDREPALKAFASGLADGETERQAQAHLAHCRQCSDFVARLNGHLHDLGGAVGAPLALDGVDGHISLLDRVGEAGERARDAIARIGGGAQETASSVSSAGGAKGAGAAGAGVFAKLAGLGTAGKIAAACVGGGVAATACVATGVAPFAFSGDSEERAPAARTQEIAEPRDRPAFRKSSPATLPTSAGNQPEPAATTSAQQGGAAPADDPGAPKPVDDPAPEPVSPVEPTAPPVEQEFGVAATATPAPAPSTSTSSSSAGGSAGGGSAVEQEFGP